MDKSKINIVEYRPQYKEAFKHLNKEWIDEYFVMEAADYKSLDHPEENVINKGGQIYFLLYNNEPIGVCALAKSHYKEFDYELSKMGITKEYQGLGLGTLLATRVVDEAKTRGAKKIFLESNSVLDAALNLYRKLGFKEIEGLDSPYQRSDIMMVLEL